MAWLLFLDESGHDHRQMPYEVRGGIAIQDSQLWPFTRAVQQLEHLAFGCSLHDFQKELKGSTLLDRKRFRFANQTAPMTNEERQKHCRAFLTKGFQKLTPNTGRYRSQWIVPTPFFVSSDMAYPVQAADLCIYCVNWAFRLPTQGMNEPVREEIRTEFYDWLRTLQFRGDGYRDGNQFELWGICYVPNPCAAGRQ